MIKKATFIFYSFWIILLIALFFVYHEGTSSENLSEHKNKHSQEITAPAQLLLTSKKDGTVACDKFVLPGKVFAYLTFDKELKGKQILEGYWIRPDGELQENPKIEIDFSSLPSKKAYLYMNVYEKSSIEHFGFRSKGTSARKPFDGQWMFEARLNGSLVASSTFSVTLFN
jgi:hypothetical protein